MKPFIGILPSYSYEAKQIFLNKSYLDEIMASGAVPYVLPLTSDEETISEILSHIDGIIFSGGSDINPNYYGKEDTGKSKEINPLRDECEETYIKIALKKDMPILGICRGMQALNVFCGGSLIEDIPSEYKVETIHNLEKPDIAFHKITVLPDTPLADIIGAGVHTVNSYHHQAVDSLAPYFSIAAVSEDGITESIFRNDKRFVLGVQWHPERDHIQAQCNKIIIDRFVEICSSLKGE